MPELFFASTEELVAGLSLCRDHAAWQQPARRIGLTAQGLAPAWLLATAKALPGAAASAPVVRRETDRLTISRGGRETDYTLGPPEDLPSLVQALPLVPRHGPAPVTSYVEVADAERYRDLVRSNLLLGNDQMAAVSLGAGRALLRVQGLSAFLSQRWLGDGDVKLYQPSQEQPRLLLPWGLDHPQAGRLDLGADRPYWLVDVDLRWTVLRGTFRDVYEHLALDPAALAVEQVTGLATLPRVHVALRLEPAESTDRPQLWRLGSGQRGLLERLLAEASEAELSGYQVACLQPSEGGEPWYLLCERPGAGHRMPPPLGGSEPYYARLPDEHLYVPAGQRLAPFLSRRGLVEALGLSDDHLTLLARLPDERVQVVRVARSALRPLGELVDYFAAEAAPAVISLFEQVTLELDLKAPEVVPETSSKPQDEPVRPPWWRRLWGGGR